MDVRLERQANASIISAAEPLACCTWAPHQPKRNGLVEAIVNRTLGENEFIDSHNLPLFCRQNLESLGLNADRSIMLLTRVSQAALRHERVENQDTGLAIDVFCTAGLGNAVAPGDPTLFDEENEEPKLVPGTINMVVLVNRNLSPSALLELTQVVTMAKCQALYGLGRKSYLSERIALGTGTDCTVLAGRARGRQLCYGSMIVKLGELTARAAEAAVYAAARLHVRHLARHA